MSISNFDPLNKFSRVLSYYTYLIIRLLFFIVIILMTLSMIGQTGTLRTPNTKRATTEQAAISSQFMITRTSDTNVLQDALLVPNSGINITSITFTGSDSAAGTFIAAPLGIDDGIILASGDVVNALPPDASISTSTDFGLPGDALCDSIVGPSSLSFDAARVTITFDADDSTNSISFQFIFGSEEYPEFVGLSFNDVFGAFLNNEQIAFDENGAPITINGPFFSSSNVITPPTNGLEYDGSTGLLQSQAPVTPGSSNTLIFVICDVGDGIYDSGILLASFQGTPDTTGGPTTGFPPQVSCPDSVEVFVENELNFKIETSDPDPENVILSVTGLPSGASMNPPLPASGNPISSTFSWIPDASQVGEHIVTYRVADSSGLTASCDVLIDVPPNSPPVISHTPGDSLRDINTEIEISAAISDDRGIAEAILNYRRGGESEFIPQVMSRIGTVFLATIPGSVVSSQGVDYFISAQDSFGLSTRDPAQGVYSIRVSLLPPGVAKDTPQPTGTAQTAYRLFSVPLDLDDKDPAAVLEDDLDQYDKRIWRFFEFRGDEQVIEFPNTSEMIPGKAFWLIVAEERENIDTGPGRSNSTARPYAIPLDPGWNYVANPFNFPTFALDSLKSGSIFSMYFYEGGWSMSMSPTGAMMLPFEGYAVFNSDSVSVDTMFVNPDNSLDSTSGQSGTNNPVAEAAWSIQILGQSQQAKDNFNFASVAVGSSREWDEYDQPEPPVIGEYVSIYFPHGKWKRTTSRYSIDSRPEPEEGEIWEFDVRTNIRDKVNLTFESLEQVPEVFEIWVADEKLKTAQNLREEKEYVVAGSGENYPKHLLLIVGRSGFVESELSGIQIIPPTYELSQNFPNPFNPATTIRYGFPKPEKVTLKIYNILGQNVVTLINDDLKKAGYHTVVWDGRNLYGQRVASGVYVYQLQASSISRVKKLILLK